MSSDCFDVRVKSGKKSESSAIAKALESGGDWYINEAWMQENVGRFVKECVLVERRNNLGEEELRRRQAAIEQDFGGVLYTDQYHRWQPRRWAGCHNYTLRVVVADPKWAAHLEPGLEFGTTGYDVWFEGPPVQAAAPKAAKKPAPKAPARRAKPARRKR